MKKALVAYDFSPYARRALGLAMQGYPFGKEIELEALHVVDERLYASALSRHAIPSDAAIEAYFAAEVERIKASLAPDGKMVVRPKLCVRRGHPYETLLDQLEKSQACGLWIGGQGNGGITETILGRNARRVLQHSRCAVYVTKQQESVTLPSLALCAVDLHTSSEIVLRETHRLTTEFQIPFSIIHILETTYAPYLQQMSTDEKLAENFHRLRAMATDELTEFEQKVLGALHAHTRRVVIGNAREEILNEATALLADTIVIGSHGRNPLSRALLGSVAEGLLDRSDKDVYVVREAADSRKIS